MLEEGIARWVSFNSDNLKSRCCRCHSSFTTFNSCINSSQLRIFKNKAKRSNNKGKNFHESPENTQNLLCKKMTSMEINKEKSSVLKSKYKSISVDDLEIVVKQLIEESLQDNEETIQLEMMVCNEDYFQKFTKVRTENRESEQILEILKKKEVKSEETNLERIVSEINHHYEEIQLTKEESEKSLKKISTPINTSEESLIVKEPEKKENKKSKNIENCYKSTEIINEFKDSKPTVKNTLRSKLTKNRETIDKNRGIKFPEEIQIKGDFTFEAWKQAKTRAYKQLLREENKKRQRELLANAKKLERERAAHLVYFNWRRDQRKQQKLKQINLKIANEATMAFKMKSDEKLYANLQAFEEWKKRKDAKLRKEKIMWRACQQYYQQNSSTPPKQTETCKPKMNLDFDIWLDQLDTVLHQKYLRERRFQVRSFYCQPTYYGTAALIQ